MSHALTAPSPTASLRRLVTQAWSDPESRSVLVGIVAVIIVHALLFLLGPFLLRSDTTHMAARKAATPRQFNIEIAPDAFTQFRKPPPPNPTKYIEANPNAPDKVPEHTTNFSSQNQVLAQEKPQLDKHNDTPKLEGKKDIISNQTVSGSLSKPVEAPPPEPVSKASAAKTQTLARLAQDPLAGFDKMKAGEDGFGSNLGSNPNVAKPKDEKVTGVRDGSETGTVAQMPTIDRNHPRARPQLEQLHTRPAVFQDNPEGTSNIGPVAFDAKWSNYGAYLHKMMEAIQVQWDRILIDSHTEPPSGTTVTVKFTLDLHGKVTNILEVESTSSEQGKQSCLTSITMTAPYGDWTDDMIAVLGNSQDLTFQFYYQ
jgi:hypothetical protein